MPAVKVIRDLSKLLDVDPSAIAGGSTLVYDQATEKHEYEPAGTAGGPTSLTDLTDVMGETGPNKSPLGDETGELFTLTEVPTQADLDAILEQVVWHKVLELDQTWQATNPTVTLTPDGIQFGPYPDGASEGGSVAYWGMQGQPFSAVRNLAYNIRHFSDAPAVKQIEPYLRIYFGADPDHEDHDAIFTPSTQPYEGLGQGPFQEYVATAGLWRFDSDDGMNSEFGGGAPLAELLAKYGDLTIQEIDISIGWSDGPNLAGLLRWWQINGNHFVFGAP